MSKTALVHPSTAKLPPEEQRKGTYIVMPFEVQAYIRGEQLDAKDMAVVHAYYNGNVPQVVADSRTVQSPSALAAPYGEQPQSAPVKKIIRKAAPTFNDPLQALRDIAHSAATSLPDKEAYNLLVTLANRFGMEIDNG